MGEIETHLVTLFEPRSKSHIRSALGFSVSCKSATLGDSGFRVPCIWSGLFWVGMCQLFSISPTPQLSHLALTKNTLFNDHNWYLTEKRLIFTWRAYFQIRNVISGWGSLEHIKIIPVMSPAFEKSWNVSKVNSLSLRLKCSKAAYLKQHVTAFRQLH